MKESPILMNDLSVQRILAKAKIQTRRAVKPQPKTVEEPEEGFIHCDNRGYVCGRQRYLSGDSKAPSVDVSWDEFPTNKDPVRCPYGKLGDRLWIREAWRIESFLGGEPVLFGYRADGGIVEEDSTDNLNYEDWWERVAVQSTDELIEMDWPIKDDDGIFHWDHQCSPLRWRPSIFMPKWASRITLEITDVQVQRVQGISIEDIHQEGIIMPIIGPDYEDEPPDPWMVFADLWDSINAKKRISLGTKSLVLVHFVQGT